ncbi:MAG TPA: response regulator [Gammaproteobacteria bacterium]|nr:response regulator [Gammaproteobacteria bacterium]
MTRSDMVYLVDDDPAILDAMSLFLENEGYRVMQFTAARELLDAVNDVNRAVVVLDQYLDDMCGLELQAELNALGYRWPVIFISGSANIRLSVQAMKAGAIDFLEKPVSNGNLLASVESAFARVAEVEKTEKLREIAATRCSSLSTREREVMAQIVAGLSNNQIAEKLGLSVRTIEVHRANINKKMHTHTLVDLVRMADLCSCCSDTDRE